MSFDSIAKLYPILKSDWGSSVPGVSNIFDLIDCSKLAELDSKQLKQLLMGSCVPQVFAEAILNMHYCKRKLFYKRNKRQLETSQDAELGATIGVLQKLRVCYETEKWNLKSEIGFYKSAIGPQ